MRMNLLQLKLGFNIRYEKCWIMLTTKTFFIHYFFPPLPKFPIFLDLSLHALHKVHKMTQWYNLVAFSLKLYIAHAIQMSFSLLSWIINEPVSGQPHKNRHSSISNSFTKHMKYYIILAHFHYGYLHVESKDICTFKSGVFFSAPFHFLICLFLFFISLVAA